ncbi:hypothetical protein HG530_000404 [Fusarium avenaceum]|nr:hypothetical protein HG530_000404 [Fusarium avenaceum]
MRTNVVLPTEPTVGWQSPEISSLGISSQFPEDLTSRSGDEIDGPEIPAADQERIVVDRLDRAEVEEVHRVFGPEVVERTPAEQNILRLDIDLEEQRVNHEAMF